MKGKSFRLREYLITDFGSGLIGWESHYDFGVQRSGRGCLLGEILVLDEFEEEKTGYLKGEFLERLKTLPPWDHTRYFCLASQLKKAGPDRRLDDGLLKGTGAQWVRKKMPTERTRTNEGGIFRLGRYRITANPEGGIAWETWGEGNTIESGICSLESGILLLGPSRGPARDEDKKSFVQTLRGLPRWQKTLLWCRQDVLQPTRVPVRPSIPWPRQRPAEEQPRLIRTERAAKFTNDKKEGRSGLRGFKAGKLWRPGFQWRWESKGLGLTRLRSFWTSLLTFLSRPRPFSRQPRQITAVKQPPVRKVWRKSRIVWLGFIAAVLLLALLGTTLYLAFKSGHDHFHFWKHHYKWKHH